MHISVAKLFSNTEKMSHCSELYIKGLLSSTDALDQFGMAVPSPTGPVLARVGFPTLLEAISQQSGSSGGHVCTAVWGCCIPISSRAVGRKEQVLILILA